ncbi:hypothetical protein [Patulibacter sp.]|uniref:hypothetical protein n=1 Tax=Patulibacter sp. TaxID=1912859 RepID=UPI00272123A8|nr:hypothetical protein [Patulibacter sp.]MDO9409361.1 hypothetical protein [Patulibacter sp.]
MHQTTIRFGDDLWARLSDAAADAGTSVAQYVREAAVTRLTDDLPDSSDLPAGVAETDRSRRTADPRAARARARADADSRTLMGSRDESTAVWAQARMARRRAAALREDAMRLRESHGERASLGTPGRAAGTGVRTSVETDAHRDPERAGDDPGDSRDPARAS